MNRRALRSKLLLKLRERKNLSCLPAVVGAQVEWICGPRRGDCKTGIGSRDLFNFLKIIKMIGRDEEPSIFSQRLANRV